MSAPNKQYDPVEVAVLSPDEVAGMRDAALAAIAAADSLDELKTARLAHAGDRSPLALANAEIGALPPQARAEAGKRVGTARREVTQALAARQEELEAERDQRALVEEAVDVTLPWDRAGQGARHPVTTLSERLADVFVAMGYEIAEGPEVEAEWYNFDALNFPPDHPAREQYDTMFVAGPGRTAKSGVVLRTHTSPVQIRAMLTRPLPLYVVSPGKCFRTDTLDATHSPVFHQIEGLAVDEGLTMADLRGAINAFVEVMFGEGLRTRLRPDFFPFTDPAHTFLPGEDDAAASRDDVNPQVWPASIADPTACDRFVLREVHGFDPDAPTPLWMRVRLARCGMVNPKVLIACGIDPDRYSGFAFGLGIERSLMIRHGLGDIRDTLEGDVRFSRAFGMEV